MYCNAALSYSGHGVAAHRKPSQAEVLWYLTYQQGATKSGLSTSACLLFKCFYQWKLFQAKRTNDFDKVYHTLGDITERANKNVPDLGYILQLTANLSNTVDKREQDHRQRHAMWARL